MENNIDIENIKIVFCVPYRDRIEHKTFFDYYMQWVLEDYKKDEYIILYIHQKDTRPFNRGAMKNLGFLYMKKHYPHHYLGISYVFHDVDSVPYRKGLLNYRTTEGNIKHYYGYDFALGGIVSINGKDFEKMNGFPNYWAWGLEDNILQRRANHYNIHIDRNNFFEIKSKKILHFMDDLKKYISVNNYNKMDNKHYIDTDGLNKINKLTMYIEKEPIPNTFMINVTSFESQYNHNVDKKFITHSVFDGSKVRNRPKRKIGMNLFGKQKLI